MRLHRFGVVGCGRWGHNHLRIINDWHLLVAACDSNTETISRVWRQYRIPCYLSSRDMYRNTYLDAVAIAVPHDQLARECLIALAHGKHVYLEKPCALNSFDAWHIWIAAKAYGLTVYPGFIEWFNPKVLRFLDSEGLTFTRKREMVKGRSLIWDTLIHDLSLLYLLKPEWATFDCAWTNWVQREINGRDITAERTLESAIENFILSLAGIEEAKVTFRVAVETIQLAEQISACSPNRTSSQTRRAAPTLLHRF